MVEQAVEQGRSQGAVVVEDLGPLLEGTIGRNHRRAPLVAVADHLEQGIGAELIDWQVAQLVDDELALADGCQLPVDMVLVLGPAQAYDQPENSMDKVAFCGDDAAMESFFNLLQKNVLSRHS